MNLPFEDLLRAAGVAIGLVFLLVIGRSGGWRARHDLLLVVGCAVAYVVCSAPTRPCCASPWSLPLLLGAAAFPFAFWRLARVVLEDSPFISGPAWIGLALLLTSALVAAPDYLDPPGAWRSAAAVVHKLAGFGFLGMALVGAWRGWDDDLVEPRRRLRWWLLGYIGAYGLAVMLAEVYLWGARPPAWVDLLNVAAIDATLLAVLLHLVQARPAAMETLFAASPAPLSASEPAEVVAEAQPASAVPTPSDDEPLLTRLRDLMEVQLLYREPELTVGQVAERADVPEYVLRRLIHERLGHRNFAAFVNDHRLREVAQRLRDPACARRPILTLALEAGFGSIGPFNRAFRDRYGTTPSEFRSESAAAHPAAAMANPR